MDVDTDQMSGLPIGTRVETREAQFPRATTLAGRLVTLRPLDPRAHGRALYAGTHGVDRDSLWLYLFAGPFATEAAFHAYLEESSRAPDARYFTILDNDSGVPAGLAAYLNVEPAHGRIEVGSILYTPPLKRTAGATEAMYLMARHAFEDLGHRRYEWKCNALNGPSRRAALRLGFVFEGIFRQHMVIKGRNRDTAWFSMLDREWPARKTNMERWLEPQNFDATGRQRLSLSALNRATLLRLE
jgi:RimJ/RimL family protein N-acetyltransferase